MIRVKFTMKYGAPSQRTFTGSMIVPVRVK